MLDIHFKQDSQEDNDQNPEVTSPDVHFEPLVKLEKLTEIKTFEEDEETVFKM